MTVNHKQMIADAFELFEARELELPHSGKKVDWKSVDFRTLVRTSCDIQRAFRLHKKTIRYNKG